MLYTILGFRWALWLVSWRGSLNLLILGSFFVAAGELVNDEDPSGVFNLAHHRFSGGFPFPDVDLADLYVAQPPVVVVVLGLRLLSPLGELDFAKGQLAAQVEDDFGSGDNKALVGVAHFMRFSGYVSGHVLVYRYLFHQLSGTIYQLQSG